MLRAVREFSNEIDCPWVVHCSAGIGRTGTFIAIDQGIQQLEETGHVDVNDLVINIRKDRGGMVQHPEQAEFVYRALTRYAEMYGAKDETALKNPVLAASLVKAVQAVPENFTMHSSQEKVAEGDVVSPSCFGPLL